MNRRNFITTTALAIPAFSIAGAGKSTKEELIVGQGDYRYRVVADWAKVNPRQYPLFNCHEMVASRDGRLFLLGDHPDNNVLIFDRSGKVLDAWGNHYPAGHGLTIFAEGEEEVLFICDTGTYVDPQGRRRRQPGTVTKTKLNGEVIFQLGHPQTYGVYAPGQAYHPTETAVAPNGDIYVADGYGSNYVIRFDARGRYLQHFGGTDNEDPRYNLHQAHGVAVDLRDPQQPKLVVTSRNEQSFKFFTLDGEFLDQVKLPGAYVCRPVIHGDKLYAGVCFADTREGLVRQQHHGYATILDRDHRVVSNPGGLPPEYVDGSLTTMYQDPAVHGLFHHGHDVCVDGDENLYLNQWNAGGVPPVLLERV